MNVFQKIKYPILRAIDISGLSFLSPIVRLCYGEEPAIQMKKIGQWIIVPICAIILFIVLWFSVSKNIKTKSGTLPNPSETWQALGDINLFSKREYLKQDAYNMSGEERLATLEKAQARLAELPPLLEATDAKVVEAKAAHAAELKKSSASLQEKYDTLKAKYKTAQTERKATLQEISTQLQPGDQSAYDNFLSKVKDNTKRTEQEKEELSTIKGLLKEIADKKSPMVAAALREQTKIAEEKQFLTKQIDQLTKGNRSLKIEEQTASIEEQAAALTSLTGAEALKGAEKIAKAESRLEKIEEASYAKPATFWFQVRRSILCVFTGFLLGSLIAIPIGILCGLNKTFMAAMTPFIAVFKPVSPIVWLPICLIITGGFITDPDNHPLMKFLWDLPGEIGEFKINPAFIASAITVALCSLWATLANTALGVASIDKDHLNVARVLKLGFWSRLFKIIIPSSLPLIFAGLRISLGVGWMVLIAAELLASSEGIGKFVWDQFNNGASDSFAKMMVVVFVVGIVGLILDRIMIIFQRLVSFEGSPTAI